MTRYRSKTLAVWIALVAGSLGAHHLYLKGRQGWVGWAYLAPTFAGLFGVHRMERLGQDDRLAWLLVPWLGVSLSVAMLCAIVYALTPDERWDAERNPALPGQSTGWGPILGAIVALLVGAAVLISTIAFSIQKVFESQL